MRAVQVVRHPSPTATEQRLGPLSWDEVVDEFLAAQERLMREASTLRTHRWVLLGRAREFGEERGLTNVADWTEAAFGSFLAELAALRDATGAVGLSASTVSIHYRVTKQFLRWCARRGHLQDRSALDVPAPKGPDLLPRSLDPETTRRLLNAVRARARDGSRDGGRDAVMMELMLRCGIPRAEVVLLTLDSIVQTSHGEWLLRIYRPKVRKERIVPLDTRQHAMSKMLRDYVRRVRPKDTDRRELFLAARRRDGDYAPLTPDAVGRIFRRLCRHSGLHGPALHVTPHMLRHTFATRALEDEVSVAELQRALGHSTPLMSLRYAKATDEDLIRAWKRRRN